VQSETGKKVKRLSRVIDKKLKREAHCAVCGNELLNVCGLSKLPDIPNGAASYRIFSKRINGHRLIVLRLLFRADEPKERLDADLSILANELIPFNLVCKYVPRKNECNREVCLDFLFTKSGMLTGIIPVPQIPSENIAKDLIAKLEISYYDCSDLWLDMQKIKNCSQNALRELKKYKRKKFFLEKLNAAYIKLVYANSADKVKKYGKVTYIYEFKNEAGWAFRHFSAEELEKAINEGKIGNETSGNTRGLFVAMPGTYVPGKYIDIGFYDALDGAGINLNPEDIIMVLGFGAGLDIVHSLRRAGRAFCVEINPFGATSAAVNLKLAKAEKNAEIMWADIRDLAENKVTVSESFSGKISKILWNAPYESTQKIINPQQLSGFFDNYSFLEWFVPFLAESKIFAEKRTALLWRITGGNGGNEEEIFKRYGFSFIPDDEEKVFVVYRNSGTDRE
jgi:hypothetical protein